MARERDHAAYGTRAGGARWGRGGEGPAVQGSVIDLDAPLREQIFTVAAAERVAQVPGDSLIDQ